MTPAPSIKEALEHYAHEYCEGWCEQDAGCANFDDCGGCLARRALAAHPHASDWKEEEARCTCGAGHGSLEGHTDWCAWVDASDCDKQGER